MVQVPVPVGKNSFDIQPATASRSNDRYHVASAENAQAQGKKAQ